MTNNQALSALNEYTVDSQLIEKILIDRGVNGSGTYSGTDAQIKAIDLAYADVCVALATNPDIKEGSQSIVFDRKTLLTTAQGIYERYGDAKGVKVNGKAIW